MKKMLTSGALFKANRAFLFKKRRYKKIFDIRISGNIDLFLATGVGKVTIKLTMLQARTSLVQGEKIYPLLNEFFYFENIGSAGKIAVTDGTNESAVEVDWVAGQVLTVLIDSDGYDMLIGVN